MESQTTSLFFGNRRYRVIKTIGGGGMAVVYLAEDTKLEVRRALKVLKPNLSGTTAIRRRFLDEAKIMAKIESPGIVRIYDLGEEANGQIWIVMELVEGRSLADRLEHGPLSPRQAVDVCMAVLSGLAVAHNNEIIHRDIKPQNILLTRQGEVKVADFGIARLVSLDSDTKTGVTMGTFGFMSPEQRRDAKSVDARADLYSVAAMFYYCLKVSTLPDLFAESLDPAMFVDIPEPLVGIIKKATRYNREERYLVAEEMSAALREARERLPATPNGALPLVVPSSVAGKEEAVGSLVEGVKLVQTAVPVSINQGGLPRHETIGLEEAKTFLPSDFQIDLQTSQSPRQRPRVLIAVVAVILFVSVLIGGILQFVKPDERVVESVAVPPAVEPTKNEVPAPISEPTIVAPPPASVTLVVQPTVVTPLKQKKTEPAVDSTPAPAVIEAAVPPAAPALQHSVPVTWPADQAFTPEVKITNGQYRGVKVYFRLSGTKEYKSFLMTEKDGVWRATIQLKAETSGFEYHISAEPKEVGQPRLSSGSGFKPHLVRVE